MATTIPCQMTGSVSYQIVNKIPENCYKLEEKNAFQKTGDAFQEIGADIWNGMETRADQASIKL